MSSSFLCVAAVGVAGVIDGGLEVAWHGVVGAQRCAGQCSGNSASLQRLPSLRSLLLLSRFLLPLPLPLPLPLLHAP